MNYHITFLPGSEVEIEVVLPFVEFEPYVKKAAVSISKKNPVDGFRPGRAPYDVVKSRLGELTIYEEGAEDAVRKIYSEVLKNIISENQDFKDYPPIGNPEITITKLAPGNDLNFKIKIARLPKIKLPDYKSIAARVLSQKVKVLVEDQEVQKTIDWIQESRATLITIDRPALMGDRVEVDFEVDLVGDGSGQHIGPVDPKADRISEGAKSKSKNHPLILGSGKFLPGFEDNLVGMRVGDEKTIVLVAPLDWHDKTLAGGECRFKVVMKLVQERKPPDLTDDFAKNLGNFSDLNALKSNIREGILKEKEEKEIQRVRSDLIGEIAAKSDMDIPQLLVLRELDKMFEEVKSGVKKMGMKWEDYLLHIYPTGSQTQETSLAPVLPEQTSSLIKNAEEALAGEWAQEAKKRVKYALILREIARLLHIEPGEEEVGARINKILQSYPSPEDAKNIDSRVLEEYTRGVLRNEKVFEFLENNI